MTQRHVIEHMIHRKECHFSCFLLEIDRIEEYERSMSVNFPHGIIFFDLRFQEHIIVSLFAQFEGEPDTYRPPEEVEAWIKREPIAPYRRQLTESGILTHAEAEEIEAAVLRELEDAVEFGRRSPDPEPESALEDLWA